MATMASHRRGLVTNLGSDEAIGLQDQHLHLIHGLRNLDNLDFALLQVGIYIYVYMFM